ncbi:hypothetical protein EBB06_01085 [Crenobacter cavernae]|uniref:Uncharacterized protein n=1 Tax=Crenobacter cavernae TaxID=2290923 RepID=A0ABY0FIR4_9NEIS|nr:hypothetical protein EBB06_01085 [Crenobacter cavernae]
MVLVGDSTYVLLSDSTPEWESMSVWHFDFISYFIWIDEALGYSFSLLYDAIPEVESRPLEYFDISSYFVWIEKYFGCSFPDQLFYRILWEPVIEFTMVGDSAHTWKLCPR